MTYAERSVELLKKLIVIDSSQPEGNEDKIVNHIASCFPKNTVMHKIKHDAKRSSLVVEVPGERDEGCLAFVGHLDTVAFGDPSKWIYPPLSAYETDGKIFGRGASDMKAGVAAMTAAALALLESGRRPKKSVYFCYTADEENGGMGICSMVGQGIFNKVGEIIIAEPTENRIGTCEKGALWMRITAHGVQAHGSRPELGRNAIDMLMDFHHGLRAFLDMKTSHPILGRASISVTRLTGGIMTNVIPAEAIMELDIRIIPGQDHRLVCTRAEEVIRRICSEDARIRLDLEVLNNRPAMETPADAPILSRMRKLLGEKAMNTEDKGLYFYTDMSQITVFHPIPFIIMGPGDDKLAHQTDEYVTVDSVKTATDLYIRYLDEYY